MMAQYKQLKASLPPEYMLLFRMGDFYELFFEDAAAASAALDIALTTRGSHGGAPIPMAGVPVHAANVYISRLIKKGYLVALADQIEEPAAARARGAKIVDRAITQRFTPGTLTDDALLKPRAANYLAALSARPGAAPTAPPGASAAQHGASAASAALGLGWIDVSTGEWFVSESSVDSLPGDLARLHPAEVVMDDAARQRLEEPELAAVLASYYVNPHAPECVAAAESTPGSLAAARSALDGPPFSQLHASAGNLLLDAVGSTLDGNGPVLKDPQLFVPSQVMQMDPMTRASLELTASTTTAAGAASTPTVAAAAAPAKPSRGPSLLSSIDKTVTGPGGRLLASRLASPLTDRTSIEARHDAVASYVAAPDAVKAVRSILRSTGDLSRSLQRLCSARSSPRDLGVIAKALAKADALAELELPTWPASHPELDALRSLLDSALSPALPPSLSELSSLSSGASVIAPGYSAELDAKRKARDHGSELVRELEAQYQDMTGIAALKIKHNSVMGYFVQVPAARKARMDEFAPELFHVQSMASSHRYASAQLKDLERSLAQASSDALLLETSLFDELCGSARTAAPALFDLSDALAELDVNVALAKLAADNGYVRPTMASPAAPIAITNGRHPLVEGSAATPGSFTPNDCVLDLDGDFIHILTGANMGGKSTYLRQNALIVILAQAGSFVPADAATIGVVDAIYSRVGAADDLAGDRSTFMVEMVESANILKSATSASLVLMDEIGRGTSTYDGMAIAWAIVEHLAQSTRARTLFATHYHELTRLADSLPGTANYAMDIRELEHDLLFLYKVVPGVASKSYGLHVAKLAGIPDSVIARSYDILDALTRGDVPAPPSSTLHTPE